MTAFQRWLRRVLVAWTVLVVVGTAALVAGSIYARYRYGQIKKLSIPGLRAEAGGGAPMNILLVGDNCRFCLDGSQANAFGTAQDAGGAHSDVTMVLHLDPQHHRAAILSIPRDLVAPVPNTPDALKIDAALNNGPTRLVQTVQDDLGIPINHYMDLNFDTFQKVVAALGGIDMYFPVPVKDAYSSLNVATAGCRHLDGFQSLALVRARHLSYFENGAWRYDGLGDLSRIKRDHTFLRVLAASVGRKGLSNPLTLNAVVGSITPNLKVDSGFSLSTMLALVRTFRSIDPNTVPTYTLPVVVNPAFHYRYRGNDLGSVVLPSEPADRFITALSVGSQSGAADPSSTSIQVVNGSGANGQAARIAQQLSALGYHIAGTGAAAPAASPSETVIYYAAGHEAQAQRLRQDLSGAVIMGQTATPRGTGLELLTGGNLSVASQGPAPAAGTQRGTREVTPPPAPTGTTLPTPTQADPPTPAFDPTACH